MEAAGFLTQSRKGAKLFGLATLRLCDFALKGLSYPWNPRNPRFSSFGCGFAALCSLWLIHLWLRLAVLGFLRIFAVIQSKCLPMNHLYAKLARFQSRSIKVYQGKSR